MHLINRLLITYLLATAIAVGLHFVFAAFYQDAVDTGKMWEILDWFMAAAVLISLVVWYISKIDLDQNRSDNTVSRRYLEVNAGLFAANCWGCSSSGTGLTSWCRGQHLKRRHTR